MSDTKIAVSWDLDGTLFDSYFVIADNIRIAAKEHGLDLKLSDITEVIRSTSVSKYLSDLEKQHQVDGLSIGRRASELDLERTKEISLIYGAHEILTYLKEKNIAQFVITHRGASTEGILRHLGILDFFDEIITAKSGYKRKPDSESANYLLQKYNLSKDNFYYIGDRTIDMEFAHNAQIKGILFLDNEYTKPYGDEFKIIKKLFEIKNIF